MPFKETVEDIYGLFPKLLEAVELLQRSAVYSNPRLLDDADTLAKEIHLREKDLTERLVAMGRSEPLVQKMVSIPGHIERIGDYIESMSKALRIKANGGILFSDKAMDEINFLFEKIKDILSNTSDMLLARNRIVAGYVREAELALTRSANEFATMHEERLIEGLCMPKASSIYLDMLDAFKAIAWHSKEIAQKLLD
ncbi:MAG: hypothetical protein M0Z59_03845 [Nitrospiraceae bacterium]|nr:hypothetical protein [Nitrospiraceae bacterium]